MKRIVLLIILCLLLVTGCGSGSEPESTATLPPTGGPSGGGENQSSPGGSSPAVTAAATPQSIAAAADYFAFKKDVRLSYKGTGSESASYEAYVDYIKDSTVQLRQVNAGSTAVFVYKLEGGAIKKVFMRGETYFGFDFTGLSNEDEILIKEPIQTGTSWKLKDGSTRSITAVEKEIETASGKYETMEVTTEKKDSTQKDYYSKDIGLIKTEVAMKEGGSPVTSELEKTEIGIPYKSTARFFFPDYQNNKAVYEDREIKTYTNEDAVSMLQDNMKTVPAGSGLLTSIPDDAKIQKITLDDDKGIVTADFSSGLIKNMNADETLEALMIRSITATVGRYYQMQKVVITVEGKLYESGHIVLKPGDYFTVSESDTAPYQQ